MREREGHKELPSAIYCFDKDWGREFKNTMASLREASGVKNGNRVYIDTLRSGHKARLRRAHEEPQRAQRKDRLSSVIHDPTVNCKL